MDLPCRSSRVTNSALLGDPFRDAPRNYESTAVDLKWGASLKLRYAGRPAVATERIRGARFSVPARTSVRALLQNVLPQFVRADVGGIDRALGVRHDS